MVAFLLTLTFGATAMAGTSTSESLCLEALDWCQDPHNFMARNCPHDATAPDFDPTTCQSLYNIIGQNDCVLRAFWSTAQAPCLDVQVPQYDRRTLDILEETVACENFSYSHVLCVDEFAKLHPNEAEVRSAFKCIFSAAAMPEFEADKDAQACLKLSHGEKRIPAGLTLETVPGVVDATPAPAQPGPWQQWQGLGITYHGHPYDVATYCPAGDDKPIANACWRLDSDKGFKPNVLAPFCKRTDVVIAFGHPAMANCGECTEIRVKRLDGTFNTITVMTTDNPGASNSSPELTTAGKAWLTRDTGKELGDRLPFEWRAVSCLAAATSPTPGPTPATPKVCPEKHCAASAPPPYANVLDAHTNMPDLLECAAACRSTAQCTWYTYTDTLMKECVLFDACPTGLPAEHGIKCENKCTTRPVDCPATPAPIPSPTPSPTPATPSTGCVKAWGQCGGVADPNTQRTWSKSCCAGTRCNKQSVWYAQCVPENAAEAASEPTRKA